MYTVEQQGENWGIGLSQMAHVPWLSTCYQPAHHGCRSTQPHHTHMLQVALQDTCLDSLQISAVVVIVIVYCQSTNWDWQAQAVLLLHTLKLYATKLYTTKCPQHCCTQAGKGNFFSKQTLQLRQYIAVVVLSQPSRNPPVKLSHYRCHPRTTGKRPNGSHHTSNTIACCHHS